MMKVGGYMPLTKPHPFHYKYQEYLYTQDYFMKNKLFASFITRDILCITNRVLITGKYLYRCHVFRWYHDIELNIIPFRSEYNNEIVSLFLGEEI